MNERLLSEGRFLAPLWCCNSFSCFLPSLFSGPGLSGGSGEEEKKMRAGVEGAALSLLRAPPSYAREMARGLVAKGSIGCFMAISEESSARAGLPRMAGGAPALEEESRCDRTHPTAFFFLHPPALAPHQTKRKQVIQSLFQRQSKHTHLSPWPASTSPSWRSSPWSPAVRLFFSMGGGRWEQPRSSPPPLFSLFSTRAARPPARAPDAATPRERVLGPQWSKSTARAGPREARLHESTRGKQSKSLTRRRRR